MYQKFQREFKLALGIFIILLLFLYFLERERPPSKRLHFISFGDYGIKGELNQTILAKAFTKWCEYNPCDYIMTLGDNFYSKGVENSNDVQFKQSFEDIYLKSKTISSIPWYAIHGNHDYRGNPQAQLEYAQKTKTNWKMPFYYYQHYPNINGFGVNFVFIDTNPMVDDYYVHEKMNISALTLHNVTTQFQWIDQTLKDTKEGDWKILLGHHPVYTNRFKSKTLTSNMIPIIQRNKVDLYINGHDHNVQVFDMEECLYITSGTGCMVKPIIKHKSQTFVMEEMSFTYVTIDRDQMVVKIIDFNGKIRKIITRLKERN